MFPQTCGVQVPPPRMSQRIKVGKFGFVFLIFLITLSKHRDFWKGQWMYVWLPFLWPKIETPDATRVQSRYKAVFMSVSGSSYKDESGKEGWKHGSTWVNKVLRRCRHFSPFQVHALQSSFLDFFGTFGHYCTGGFAFHEDEPSTDMSNPPANSSAQMPQYFDFKDDFVQTSVFTPSSAC